MPYKKPTKELSFLERIVEAGRFLLAVLEEWNKDHPDLLAAGLGYFSLFSLVPLFVISSATVGSLWANHVNQASFVSWLSDLLGSEIAQSMTRWLDLASSYGKGKATAISVVILLLGASRIFAQVRTALDMIWDIEPRPTNFFRSMTRTILMNFGMLAGLLLFLLTFVFLDAAVAFVTRTVGNYVPGYALLLQVANFILPLALFTILFSAAYKLVPDTHVAWSDAFPGGLVTAFFMGLGKIFIGLYLQWQSFDTVYGAASSLIVILVWIYFAAQIFFFGAELTWLYARTVGSRQPH